MSTSTRTPRVARPRAVTVPRPLLLRSRRHIDLCRCVAAACRG
ncbi:hypothetical protein ACFFKU_08625 [Kineococcus gynurae]|uniref:Uncharacterized protein n=1 Tax=Kineococcus gynurae TaxID=452979 RepID=A0ABV5LVY0_9ACTN